MSFRYVRPIFNSRVIPGRMYLKERTSGFVYEGLRSMGREAFCFYSTSSIAIGEFTALNKYNHSLQHLSPQASVGGSVYSMVRYMSGVHGKYLPHYGLLIYMHQAYTKTSC